MDTNRYKNKDKQKSIARFARRPSRVNASRIRRYIEGENMTTTKRVHRLARAIISQHKVNVAFSTGGDNKCHLIHGKSGKRLRADSNLINAIEHVPHKWSILIAAICRKSDGEEYMKTEQVSVPHVIYQRDLADALTDMHAELCRQCNPNHLIGAAWMADPKGSDIDESLAAKVFEELGAWTPTETAVVDA